MNDITNTDYYHRTTTNQETNMNSTTGINHPAAATDALAAFRLIDRDWWGGYYPADNPVCVDNPDGEFDWLIDAIRHCHADGNGGYNMPDDWTYHHAHMAMEFIAEQERVHGDDTVADIHMDQDLVHEWADRYTETYPGPGTAVRATWMISTPERMAAVAELMEESGYCMTHALAEAYQDEVDHVFMVVLDRYKAHTTG